MHHTGGYDRRVRRLTLSTDRREQMIDVTELVSSAVAEMPDAAAVLLHVPHTTAAVTVNEGYDPAVAADVLGVMGRLVPRDDGYRHLEGNSDSHAKAIMVGSDQLIPLEGGGLALGRWQRVFFCEFDGPRSRELWISPLGG
jgi:secondary thiamine-phosphate synthase enzyme